MDPSPIIPATKVSVGDEVFLGNIDDAVVVAVLEEGRRVAVQHTKNQDRDYQGPPEKTVQLVPAFEVQRKSNESEQAFSRPNYYIEENTDVFDPACLSRLERSGLPGTR